MPTFAPVKGWTLGGFLVVADHGKRSGGYRYMVFATDPQLPGQVGVGEATTENDAEEKMASLALADLRRGVRDSNNSFVAFIGANLSRLTWLEAAKSDAKTLELKLAAGRRSPGTLQLRVSGDTLYFLRLQIDTSGSHIDRYPELTLGSAPQIRP